MLRLKVIAVAGVALLNNALIAADLNTDCILNRKALSCNIAKWQVGVQGLYLQNNFNKSLSYYPTGENEIYNSLGGHWNGGFQLEASYQLKNKTDITLQGYYLEPGKHIYDFDPLGEFGFVNVVFSLKNRWNAGSLEFGQSLNVTKHSKVRFFEGIHYARIELFTHSTVSNTLDADFSDELNSNSYHNIYNGIGPRFGLDMNYFLEDGFTVHAKTAAALIIGSEKVSAYGINNAFVSLNSGIQSTLTYSKTNLVPELEAQFGISYAYSSLKSSWVLDVGYMWFNYFNSLNGIKTLSNSPIGQSSTDFLSSSDYGASGPYIGLKYFGNI